VDTISNVNVTNNQVSRTGPNAAGGALQLLFVGPFNGSADQTNVVVSGNTFDGGDKTLAGDVGVEIGNTSGNGFKLSNATSSNNTIQNNETGLLASPGTGGITITDGQFTNNVTDVQSDFDTTFDVSTTETVPDVIKGAGGVIKVGQGTLTLQGTNTYSGDTNINEGTVLVTGSLLSTGKVFVNPNGTLGGTGSVGSIKAVGGTVSVDNGTLTAANADFSLGGILQVAISGAATGGNYATANFG